MTGHPFARATRRATLGGVLVGLGVTGCEVEAPPPTPAEAPTPTTPQPDADPDTTLVESVVEELDGALALVTGASRARRSLGREALAPWRALHTAHLAALDAGPPGPRPPPVRGSAPAVRGLVRRNESRLQRRLAEQAGAAQSGSLASLIATMSAGVAQQLTAPSDGAAP